MLKQMLAYLTLAKVVNYIQVKTRCTHYMYIYMVTLPTFKMVNYCYILVLLSPGQICVFHYYNIIVTVYLQLILQRIFFVVGN